MKNLWDKKKAAKYKSKLALRVYTSRLLGQDPSLVLHGGGNTSVKIKEKNEVGETEEILYVKGSGWDLATIEEAGFSPVRMDHLLKLAKLKNLSDPAMVNELKTQMKKATAPGPSVETILHATLPFTYVDHTHADAVVTVTNTRGGKKRIEDIYGDEVVIIPYVMPGFDLARECAQKFEKEATEKTIGMILLNHGVFSFGKTAKESYDRMIYLVDKAEKYLKKKKAWSLPSISKGKISYPDRIKIARLRRDISKAANAPMTLLTNRDKKSLAFTERRDLNKISQQGPATPDHVIRTKRLPMIGSDVEGYKKAYKAYFEQCQKKAKEKKTILDPAPRVILDRELGVISAGANVKAARIIDDIYSHTIEIILRATALGTYKALPPQDIFDVEYWDLEQAKLKKGGRPPLFSGEVALVTGAASGIGKACAEALLSRGAAVIGLDMDKKITQLYDRPDFLGVMCNVTKEKDIDAALHKAALQFGGLDMVVLNAGLFMKSAPIADIGSAQWRKIFDVNLDANLSLLRMAHPLLALAPNGGRVAVVGSKNVPAPGPGAAPYSASKAALTQLARVAALEWGGDGIRVNIIHPDAVFDTAIWTDEVLTARAKSYGMTVDQYKTKNILKTEVASRDVAEMAAEMLGPLFAKTTGAQVPIDGGNDRVI